MNLRKVISQIILLAAAGTFQVDAQSGIEFNTSLSGIHFPLGQNGAGLSNGLLFPLNLHLAAGTELSLAFGKYQFEPSGNIENYSEARLVAGKLLLWVIPLPEKFDRLRLGFGPSLNYYSSMNNSEFERKRENEIQGSTFYSYSSGFLEVLFYSGFVSRVDISVFRFKQVRLDGFWELAWNYSPIATDYYHGGIKCVLPLGKKEIPADRK